MLPLIKGLKDQSSNFIVEMQLLQYGQHIKTTTQSAPYNYANGYDNNYRFSFIP